MVGLIGGKTCRSCEHRRSPPGAGMFCVFNPPQIVGVMTPQGVLIQSNYPPCVVDFPCSHYQRNEMFASEELRDATEKLPPQGKA